MKTVLASALILVSSITTASDWTPAEDYAYTTSCAIILGAALKQIDRGPGISFGPTDPGVAIQDWIDIRLAASAYEDASAKYLERLDGIDVNETVAAIYEKIVNMPSKEQGAAGKQCLEGYKIYRSKLDDNAI